MINYYKILGINKNATEIQIKEASKKLAKNYNPKKPNGNEKNFILVLKAYDILGNKKKRNDYDKLLNNKLNTKSSYYSSFSSYSSTSINNNNFKSNEKIITNRNGKENIKTRTIQKNNDGVFIEENINGKKKKYHKLNKKLK